MSTKNILILVIIGLAVLAGIYFLSPKTEVSTGDISNESGLETYSSLEYGITFSYPSNYLLAERDAGTPEMPQKAIILLEDNEENRAILEGRTAEVGEGPTAIVIDIFQNPTGLAPEPWVQANTNWLITDKGKESVTIDGKLGFTYFWDGLYAGKSSVATSGNRAYIFSVTWITSEDQMVKDFENLLSSIKFSN